MNITHTPGTWEVHHGSDGPEVHASGSSGERVLADIISEWCGEGRAEANARLIAQAPTLLAECRIALAYLEQHPFINHAGVECEPAICHRLRKAIKEAS